MPASSEVPPSGGVRIPIPAAFAGRGPVAHALFRVSRLHRLHARQLLQHIGLHPAQELVMLQLWDRGPQRQADLVERLGSDRATMTRTVRRLEAAGFVRRRPSEHDKRSFIIEPTAASQALRSEVERIWSDLEAAVTHNLTEEQRAQLLGLLEQTEASLIPIVSTAEADEVSDV